MTWGDVKIGSYIRSKDGVVWKVEHHKPGSPAFWGMRKRDGETKILPAPPATAPVDIMYLNMSEAEAQLRDELGAEVFAEKYDGEGVWRCPPFNSKRIPEMKFHLELLHGVAVKSVNDPGQPAGMNSKKALIECHDAQHADPGPRWTPHIHEKEVSV